MFVHSTLAVLTNQANHYYDSKRTDVVGGCELVIIFFFFFILFFFLFLYFNFIFLCPDISTSTFNLSVRSTEPFAFFLRAFFFLPAI